MIASVLALALKPIKPFADIMQDPFWRWPALALVLSFAGLATYPIEKSWKGGRGYFANKRESKRRVVYLRALTKDEKKALQAYIVKGTKTARWNIESGVIAGLVSHGILYPSSKYGTQVSGFAHNISEWAWAYLHEHPECVETPGDMSIPDAFN